jgi:hypothetical protein
MNFENLKTELQNYGTVDHCGFNGDNINQVIIAMSNINNSTTTIETIHYLIRQVNNGEFPKFQHIGMVDDTLKVVITK